MIAALIHAGPGPVGWTPAAPRSGHAGQLEARRTCACCRATSEAELDSVAARGAAGLI